MHLDDIKAFVHVDRDKKRIDMILPVFTTLISGLVIIISISPEYLRELHPLTLLLLSIACALPVWALNQLLWWHLGKRVSGEIVGKVIHILNLSDKEKKVLSFALSRLMKAIDVMRFIPSKNMADLTTILVIYLGAVVMYFSHNSPALLYSTILLLSLSVWLVGLFFLHKEIQKINMEPLKIMWDQLKNNDQLLSDISSHFVRLEKLIQERVSIHLHGGPTPEPVNPEESGEERDQ